MNLTIYLNKDGKGFEVVKQFTQFEPILLQENEAFQIHPVIHQIVTANSSETVSSALKELKKISEINYGEVTSYFFRNGQQINNYDNFIIRGDQNKIVLNFSILHKHGPYKGQI